MAIPFRGPTGQFTYFITAGTTDKRQLLQSERSASLLIDVFYHHRGKYLLHEFVIMPDHFHLLITPAGITLERSLQLIKGGFSFRFRKETGQTREIWQNSFYDHRVRNAVEYARFRNYIHQNPVKKGIVTNATDYDFSSANPKFELDEVPQGLKPLSSAASESQA
jgi:REP-associated tyrosine transposase